MRKVLEESCIVTPMENVAELGGAHRFINDTYFNQRIIQEEERNVFQHKIAIYDLMLRSRSSQHINAQLHIVANKMHTGYQTNECSTLVKYFQKSTST